MKKAFAIGLLTLVSLSAWAAPQTVTLELPTMNCAMCPITVKKALTRVDGVTEAKVNFDTKQAVVTFDDSKTNEEALVQATTNAGYPSTVRQTNHE